MSEAGIPSGSTKAKLLVAVPGLLDPNFRRTVVLILEHNDDGAVSYTHLTLPPSDLV